MNGLQLSSMELADMLDVIHVIFEDDMTSVASAEQVDVKETVREIIYRDFYETTYKYKTTKKRQGASIDNPVGDFDYSDITPFDPSSQPVKPFVPATDFNPDMQNPFGSTLDAPLG
jgi:hypothetical protein